LTPAYSDSVVVRNARSLGTETGSSTESISEA
jgi:hypothetical protein